MILQLARGIKGRFTIKNNKIFSEKKKKNQNKHKITIKKWYSVINLHFLKDALKINFLQKKTQQFLYQVGLLFLGLFYIRLKISSKLITSSI